MSLCIVFEELSNHLRCRLVGDTLIEYMAIYENDCECKWVKRELLGCNIRC